MAKWRNPPPGIRKAKAQLVEAVTPLCVSVDQAQAMTSISRWTWRSWAQRGVIASFKIGGRNGKLGRGGRLLIPVSEVRRMLEENFRPAVINGPAPKDRLVG